MQKGRKGVLTRMKTAWSILRIRLKLQEKEIEKER